jgi:hypothetical protein
VSATVPQRPATGPLPRPARDHCLAPGRGDDAPAGASRYGRLFPDLPALRDGAEVLSREGRRAIADDESPFVATDAPGDPETDAQTPAGWPVFAQFVAHDLTADRSALAVRAEVADLRNVRAPRLNLECVYGRGPADQPYLYSRHDPAKLLAGPGDDVPRNPEGVALVADPRNDVHQPIAQLHLAFLRAHGRIVDRLRADGTPEAALFEEAQRSLRWHFQWILLHDFLPTLVGPELAARMRDGGREHFLPGAGEDPFVPVEFADAAFRYGHSQVRERYAMNAAMAPARLFPDLLGFRPVPPEHVADWGMLFDLPGRPPAPQRAKRIDGRLVPSLIRLPTEITGDLAEAEHKSLAVRDLQRGLAVGLPSGEAVARHLGVAPLTEAELGVRHLGWTWETPLWFYVLKEAEVREGGERLGPVGGTIVAEVVTGVVDLDPTSFRAVDPGWRPTLPAAGATFTLADLLVLATPAG